MGRLSTEKIVNNVGDPIQVSTVQSVGAVSNRSAISVTSTAQQLLIGAGKRSMELYNNGTKDMYYGGSGVTSATGIPIPSGTGKIFANVKDTFSIYLVTDGADTTNTRIVEYT